MKTIINGYTFHDHIHAPLKRLHYWNCFECKEVGTYNTTAESLAGYKKHCATARHKKKKVEWSKRERQQLDRKYGAGTADMLDELAEMGKDLVPKGVTEDFLPPCRAERRKK